MFPPNKYATSLLHKNLIRDGTNPKFSEHGSARKGGDHDASQVGCDEVVDELGITGYGDVEGQVVDILNSGDDDEEMRRGFLKKNGDKIGHEAILKV
jgi:hypothetical protein